MPLQNRVSPLGEIVATPHRGTMMGIRGGCIHRDDKTLLPRQWASKRWLVCLLAFKNRRRALMQPGRYTELFFLDEATGFAAGHRPCFECRRADALKYQQLWAASVGRGFVPKAGDMDEVLHAERIVPVERRPKRCPANLPDGAFVLWREVPHLVLRTSLDLARRGDSSGVTKSPPPQASPTRGEGVSQWPAAESPLLYPWSFAGYGAAIEAPDAPVIVLTPPSTLAILAAQYMPTLHASAHRPVGEQV